MFRWRSKVSIHREMQFTPKKGETWRSHLFCQKNERTGSRRVHTVRELSRQSRPRTMQDHLIRGSR
jgi:hypothetical protein